MLTLTEVHVAEEFGNTSMPHQMRITHLRTCCSVLGNCKNEDSKPKLKDTLMQALALQVMEYDRMHPTDPVPDEEDDDEEKLAMREQLRFMRAQIDKLMGKAPAKAELKSKAQPEAKASKRAAKKSKAKPAKGGWTPERREQAAERMRKMQAAKRESSTPAEPEPVAPSEAELLRQQMRPPTEAPFVLPKDHRSKGGTVVKVSPEALAKGYRP